MSSIDEIAKLKIEPLDDKQIEDEDMEDGTRDIKIITYNDMKGIECLDCLFDKHDYIMLLYQTDSPTSGHWVSLIRDKKLNTVFYFVVFTALFPIFKAPVIVPPAKGT